LSDIANLPEKYVSPAYGVACVISKCGAAALFGLTLLMPLSVAHAETLRLVALGDSLTQGYGLVQEEGFVPQLQEWLRDEGFDVEVVNAGVSGDTTAGGLARMDWTLAEPVDAMLVTLGGNDLLRGISPAASRENLEAILIRLQRDGIPAILAGLPAPGNFGPEFRLAFERMYIDLSAQFEVPLIDDFLQPITARMEAGESITDLMQADNIHPNARGVSQIVAALGPQVADFLRDVAADQP
jgi:acyl-CoA thioesterase-1